ncbi:MAG: class I fructose-bisphosphate aldolase, partial [Chitinophagaceae bacterium]
LKILFYQLYQYRVDLEGIILKPNMVIEGTESDTRNGIDKVAEMTINCLLESVPATTSAIAFLSGGQSPEDASAHLNAMHTQFKNHLPWIVSFSFARALQQPVLEIWKGEDSNIAKAQKSLFMRAKLNALARQGQYNAAMED